MTLRARILAPAVLGGALLLPSLAAAQGGNKAAAEALFNAGRDLMAAGKYAEACPKFEGSQRLDAGVGTLLYLGECYEKAGRLASAWATFREAESIASSRGDQERATVARDRAVVLEPRLSKLWIKVADGNDPKLELTRNGEPIPRESWSVALPVDAGDQAIVAMAPGRKEWKTTISVTGEGASVPVDVPVLEAAPAAPAPAVSPASTTAPADPGAEEDSAGSGQRVAGIVVGAVGLVGIGVGTFFGLQAKSQNDDSLAECAPDDATRCSSEGKSLRDDAFGSATISTIAMIAGGAALAGGIVLYLTAPSGGGSDGAHHTLRLTASADGASARVGLGGAF